MFFKLLLFIRICSLITLITGQCRVELPQDAILKPKFYKTIGSHIAVIPNEGPSIDLQRGEIITAQCYTNFTKPTPENIPSITIICLGDKILGHHSSSVHFECDSTKWNLYEPTQSFRWCPPFMVSYLIARPTSSGYEYLAGVCYDFLDMSVVSLHYAITPKYSKIAYPLKLRHYTPSIEIENIDNSFVTRNISISTYDDPQFQHWIKFANFHTHSLIQNPKLLHDTYQQFGGLLEFVWWTGLRLGNWQLFEEALDYHMETEEHGYDILSGISDYVSAPIHKKHDCQQNLTLVELADRTNRKIPLYVWQYLKSPRNDSDNLVVIGINTPFQEFYQEEELIFCTDICHQINWLENVYKTFQYKALGIVFCCSFADVQASRRLRGFPTSPKLTKTTTKPVPVLVPNNLDKSQEELKINASLEEGENYNDIE